MGFSPVWVIFYEGLRNGLDKPDQVTHLSGIMKDADFTPPLFGFNPLGNGKATK